MIQEHHKSIVEMLNIIHAKTEEGFSINVNVCKDVSDLLTRSRKVDILDYFSEIKTLLIPNYRCSILIFRGSIYLCMVVGAKYNLL